MPQASCGLRDQPLCCSRVFFPLQVGLNPFKKENVDVYILVVTPSWSPRASIPVIAVTSS